MLFFWLCGFPSPASGGINVTADSAVLMEASSGQVLYAKDAYRPRPPASTTKIITALVALENSFSGEPVLVGPRPPRTGGSTLGIRCGRVYPLEDLIKAALICSANDASLAIGEHVGGNEDTFLYMMNKKAASLGARGCSFRNTNGLPAAGHLASAYDLAQITRYALRHPQFADIVKTSSTTIFSGARTIYNTNRLLNSFSGADGVKTGTTNAAGQCLVASATREGRQLIAVVLHSNNRFADAAKLLEYGFSEWEEEISFPAGKVMAVLPVKKGKPATVEAVLTERLGVSVPRSDDQVVCEIILYRNILEPLPAGARVGEAVLKWKDRELQRVPLVTKQKASKSFIW